MMIPRAEPLPLTMDEHGVVRVSGTRVPLATVVFAFNQGATPEEIVQQYPTLSLGDVYLVAGYYLQHRADVDEYLEKQRAEAEQVRREVEQRFSPIGVRERLLARRQKP